MNLQADDTPEPNYQEELRILAKKVEESFEKIGLYITAAMCEHDGKPLEDNDSLKEKLKDGGTVLINAAFRIGDLAWSERILEPENHKLNKEFSMIMSDDTDIEAAAALEELKMGLHNDED